MAWCTSSRVPDQQQQKRHYTSVDLLAHKVEYEDQKKLAFEEDQRPGLQQTFHGHGEAAEKNRQVLREIRHTVHHIAAPNS